MQFDRLEQDVQWLGHAGFRLRGGGKTIYVDPYRAAPGPAADYVLITHDHFDHFSPEDLKRVAGKRTQIIAPATVTEQMRGLSHTVAPGDALELDGLYVTVVAAYNTNKLDSEGKPFHPREAGGVGYVLTFGGHRLYHSGDTDVIPDMDRAAGVDVALLPVSGTYVMNAVEAAEAARRIQPEIAIPMHWGTVIGSREDAEQFAKLADVKVHIPERASEG